MQKSYFGIDFGTTNTAVVQILVDEHGTKTINLGEDDMPFSSLVAIHKVDGTILFGRQVKNKRRQLSRDYLVISSFKSKLSQDVEYCVADKRYTPTDITAIFLKAIKEYIYNKMKIDINAATFGIPVDFTPVQRRELLKAAKAAGIKVNKLISESTAAYMQNMDLVKGLSKVAVFDWGGGTLDISILEIRKNELKELAIHGIKLGGDDIDKLLAKKVHAYIACKKDIGDYDDMPDKDKDEIISRCEKAKIDLSDEDFTKIRLVDYGMPGVEWHSLEYESFKELIKPCIDQAIKALYEAIQKAQITVAQLDAIIMTGGSCEMRPIQDILKQLFERKNVKIISPENMQWCVANGAAMIDKLNTGYKLSHSIGVILSDDTFFPIFQKGHSVFQKIPELRFGVVEETTDAHFIITDENKNTLEIVNVPVKGFTSEGICLNAYIDEAMIAHLNLKSTCMSWGKDVEIHKLNFYYDISGKSIKAPDKKLVPIKDPSLCSFMGCLKKATRRGLCEEHYRWEYADSK